MAEPLVEASPPLDVAVMTSIDGLRLRYLLEDDHARGDSYELVCGVVTDAESTVGDRLERHGVPVEHHDIHDFYAERDAALDDLDVRRRYDSRLAGTVAEYDPDLVVLVGYLYILTEAFLEPFYPRILNCHHGDLTIRDPTGRPVYGGLRAAEAAVRGGEAATHETVHVATEDVDAGPIVARSPPFEVNRALVDDALARGDEETLDAYTYAHRRWTAAAGGGPTLSTALELVADGRVTWADGETFVDSVRGFYQVGSGVQAGRDLTAGDDA